MNAQAAIKIYQSLGGLNNRRVYLTVLQAGKLKITVPAWLGSVESLPPGRLADGSLLAVSSHGR